MTHVNALGITTMGLMLVALVLAAVGVGTDEWMVSYETSPVHITFGLWRFCSKVNGVSSSCISWHDFYNTAVHWSVPFCEGMAVTSLIFVAFGTGMAAASAFSKKSYRSFAGSSIGLSITGAVLMGIAIVTFYVETYYNSTNDFYNYPGYSMILAAVGNSLLLVCWILSCALCCIPVKVEPTIIVVHQGHIGQDVQPYPLYAMESGTAHGSINPPQYEEHPQKHDNYNKKESSGH